MVYASCTVSNPYLVAGDAGYGAFENGQTDIELKSSGPYSNSTWRCVMTNENIFSSCDTHTWAICSR